MLYEINEVAVLVAALLAVAFGSVWYSPLLFGDAWMRSMGFSLDQKEPTQQEMIIATMRALIAQGVLFFVLAQFVAMAQIDKISLRLVVMLLLVFAGVQIASSVIWEKRKYPYFFVQFGYLVCTLLGGMMVIKYWPW